jgi:hypothetical protein
MKRYGFGLLAPQAWVALAGCLVLVGMLAVGLAPAKASKNTDASNPELGFSINAWPQALGSGRCQPISNAGVVAVEFDAETSGPLAQELRDRALEFAAAARFDGSNRYVRHYQLSMRRGGRVVAMRLDAGEIMRLGQRAKADPFCLSRCLGAVIERQCAPQTGI